MSINDDPAGGTAPRRRRRRATSSQGAPPSRATESDEPTKLNEAANRAELPTATPPPVSAESSASAPLDKPRKPRKPRTPKAGRPPQVAADQPPEVPAARAPAARQNAEAPRRRRPARDNGERGMRDLAGSGPSQVGVSGALRARDVNRPTDDDLAEAERQVVIVRRPPDTAQTPPSRTRRG